MPKVGDKIKMCSEKQRYTVQACNSRFVIMTKPFNVRKTYLYTIADLEGKVRGSVGLIFGTCEDLDTPEGAMNCLKDMQRGKYEVSFRNRVPLTEPELKQLIGSES